MNTALVVGEIFNRLEWHADADRMLATLKVKRVGAYRIEGKEDLPQVMLADAQESAVGGSANGTLTLWLRVSRERGWVRPCSIDPDVSRDNTALSLLEWKDLVLDALETMQSDPEAATPDQLLVLHDKAGVKVPGINGPQVELLGKAFTTEFRMDEVNDLCMTAQINISYSFASKKTARRRFTPQLAPQS